MSQTEGSGRSGSGSGAGSGSEGGAGELALVLSSFPSSDVAGEIALTLIGEGLCACVNILREVRSIYRWKNEVVNNSEVLCLIKTSRARHAELLARLGEIHPYDVPEIVTLSPEAVNASYLGWVMAETDPNLVRRPSEDADDE